MLFLLTYLILATIAATAGALALISRGAPMAETILLSSGLSAAVVWVVLGKAIWFWLKITRGAPFKFGDELWVIRGKYRGQRVKVVGICDRRPESYVIVSDESGEAQVLMDWYHLSRRKPRSKR